jgi:hypothetical protein
MPVVHIPTSDSQFAWLASEAEKRNGHRKKGDPELSISNIAKEIFVPALEERIHGKK